MNFSASPKYEPVWYLTYGSNINNERFIKYIIGGEYRYSDGKKNGCPNKNIPVDNKEYDFTDKYKVYFGNRSPSWENGGVAFIEAIELNKAP